MDDKEFLEKILDERKKFWLDIYPKMNIQEKKEYWLSSTHKGMRLQAESFADPYSEFSKKWYDFAKVHEPEFDDIFNYVNQNLGFEFDWDEYSKRITQ